VASKLNSGTVDRYWEMMTEIAAPFVAAMSKADDATRKKIKEEVYNAVQEKFAGGHVSIDAAAIVVAAEK
jgi:hypothetical protein